MSQVVKLPKVEETRPRRGEIWRADLEPTQGAEIQSAKGDRRDTRPVLVLSHPNEGTPGVSLCVPITDYKPDRDKPRYWRVVMGDNEASGLRKISCADVSQTRALDVARFWWRSGKAHPAEVEATAAALATLAGVPAPMPPTTPA